MNMKHLYGGPKSINIAIRIRTSFLFKKLKSIIELSSLKWVVGVKKVLNLNDNGGWTDVYRTPTVPFGRGGATILQFLFSFTYR